MSHFKHCKHINMKSNSVLAMTKKIHSLSYSTWKKSKLPSCADGNGFYVVNWLRVEEYSLVNRLKLATTEFKQVESNHRDYTEYLKHKTNVLHFDRDCDSTLDRINWREIWMKSHLLFPWNVPILVLYEMPFSFSNKDSLCRIFFSQLLLFCWISI